MSLEQKTVLVIEDNLTNLNVLLEILEDAGYEVLTAKSGEEGLERAEHTLPDLILLDVLMPPGMDGFAVCARLKQQSRTREIPVIFMTALTDTPNTIRGFEIGAVDYVTKPFDAQIVLARVKNHLTLQNLQREVIQKNQALSKELQLKTHFFSMTAHELRTPLQEITGHIRQLEANLPTECEASLAGIRTAVAWQTHLLDGLLPLLHAKATDGGRQ